MPNIKSAKKRVKIITVKSERNKAARSDLRTAVKKAEMAISSGAADKADTARAAMKKLDRAVTKGILHKNTAARKKSQLAVKLNKAS